MTAKAMSDNLLDGMTRHGFAAVVATLLLYTQWSYLESATEENRRLASAMQETTRVTAEALAASSETKRTLIAQQADLERVIERQAAAFERLCLLLERESK